MGANGSLFIAAGQHDEIIGWAAFNFTDAQAEHFHGNGVDVFNQPLSIEQNNTVGNFAINGAQ